MNWFAVHSNIRCEIRAKWALDAKGYVTFMPMEKVRRHARGCKDYYRPVIPRYLFVQEAESWWPIRFAEGVESILCKVNGAGERVPALISDEAVSAFRKAVEVGLLDTKRSCGLSEGQMVKIIAGPYAHFVAKIAKVKSPERVKIMLNMFNGERFVDISPLELVAV
jgi:transcription antitermination factor NusG